ncbi:MAG TPA: TlpA disulfide reductase family protein [Bacteroidia bacterium]|nr:TlpA disulfide reductase family protein [Bacteroidia bacterium]
MIKKYWMIGLAALGLILVLLYQYQKYRVAPKQDIANMLCNDTLGKPVNISSFKGKKTILTFFATWCGDCLREMKQLDESMQNNLKDVQVIAISDEPMDKITHFAQRKKYNYTFLQLPKPFAGIDIYAIPVTYLINVNGEVVYSKVGAINWKDPAVISFAEESFK